MYSLALTRGTCGELLFIPIHPPPNGFCASIFSSLSLTLVQHPHKISGSVPGFDDLVLPLFTQLSTTPIGPTGLTSLDVFRDLTSALDAAAGGDVPKFPVDRYVPGEAAGVVSGIVDTIFEGIEASTGTTRSKVKETGVYNLTSELSRLLQQVPNLVEETVDLGTEAGFVPTRSQLENSVRRGYRARRTLVVKFKNDGIDESDSLVRVLNEAQEVMRMKQQYRTDMEVQMVECEGGHATPIIGDKDKFVKELAEWLEGIEGAVTSVGSSTPDT